MHAAATHDWPQSRVPARPGLRRRVEWLALFFLVAIAADALGFVDVLILGRAYSKTAESAFAQVLWPTAYVLFAALVLVHRRAVWTTARRVWWLLPFPALAAVSTIWSIDPGASLDGAIRIAATTVMGLYIGTRFDLGEQARAVFWVLLIAVGASILVVLAGLDFAAMADGTARGLFRHKNTLGSRAALLVVAAAALALTAWRPALGALATGAGCLAVALAQSAAGLVLALAALAVAPMALSLRGERQRVVLRLVVVGAVLAFAGFALVALRIDPVADALAALDRDATLTGRLLLWQVALHHVAENPVLGVGFNAFWNAGLDWQTFRVLDDLGYVLHFHNAYLEVAVQLGLVGGLAAALSLGGFARAALVALRTRVAGAPLWPVLFGVVALALAMVENELFVKHNLFHVLLVAIPATVLGGGTPARAERARSGAGTAHAQAVEADQA